MVVSADAVSTFTLETNPVSLPIVSDSSAELPTKATATPHLPCVASSDVRRTSIATSTPRASVQTAMFRTQSPLSVSHGASLDHEKRPSMKDILAQDVVPFAVFPHQLQKMEPYRGKLPPVVERARAKDRLEALAKQEQLAASHDRHMVSWSANPSYPLHFRPNEDVGNNISTQTTPACPVVKHESEALSCQQNTDGATEGTSPSMEVQTVEQQPKDSQNEAATSTMTLWGFGEDQDDGMPADGEFRYRKNSCCVLHFDSPVRQVFIRSMESPWFDRTSMLAILMNCVTLAMYDPFDADCETSKCQVLTWFEFGFNLFFLSECAIKVTAMGFIGQNSYLADSWNRLDFVVVAFGVVDLIPQLELPGVTLLRMARVLRPLRAINRLPGLRILIKLILETLPMLGSVVLLCTFLFVVFSILGVQLLSGVLRNRCYDADGQEYCDTVGGEDCLYICTIAPDKGMLLCPPLADRFKNFDYAPGPSYATCKADGPNPDSGVTSFDDFFHAFITMFVVISMEGWTEVMYMAQDAYSFWIWIFFLFTVISGGIMAINLFLVVITSQFTNTKAKDKAEQAQLAAENAKNGVELPPHQPTQKEKAMQVLRNIIPCMRAKPELQKTSSETVTKQIESAGTHDNSASNSKPAADTLPTPWFSARTEPVAPETDEVLTQQMPPFGSGEVGIGAEFNKAPRTEAVHVRRPSRASTMNLGPDDSTESHTLSGSGTGQANGSLGMSDTAQIGVDPHTDVNSDVVSEKKTAEPPGPPDTSEEKDDSDRGEHGLRPNITWSGKDISSSFKEYALQAAQVNQQAKRGLALRYWLKHFVKTDLFNNFIMLVIVLNTIAMATQHYNQPMWLTDLQDYLNYVFTFIFALEMFLKIIGLGFKDWKRDNMNIFDAVIVLGSLFEIGIGGGGLISVLRLMRIFKIVRFLPGLQRQMVVIIASLGQMGNFGLILLLYMFIYSILGMYLFGAKLKGRSTFDNLYRSLLTVFQMLTVEDWPGVMFDAVEATHLVASLYFISLIIGGNYILCNLFVAILLEGFAERAAEDERNIRLAFENERLKKFKNRLRKAFTSGSVRHIFQFWKGYTQQSKESRINGMSSPSRDVIRADSSLGGSLIAGGDVPFTEFDEAECQTGQPNLMVHPELEADPQESESDEESPIEEEDEEDDAYTNGNSLCLFSGANPVRIFVSNFVKSTQFDRAILLFIFLNSCVMALDRPGIEDGSGEHRFLTAMGFIFTFVFTVEAAVKVVAWGLICGKHAYLKEWWNRLDAFLVLVSIVDLLMTYAIDADGGQIMGVLKILRLLRALRPLRVINRAPKLKRVVQTLMDSLGSIGNTLMISSVIFLIFGILSVTLFSGKLHYCTLSEGTSKYTNQTITVKTQADCESLVEDDAAWKNQTYNYDNLLNALLTLFYVSSYDGWVDVLWYTVDASGENSQPVEDAHMEYAMFFVVFLLISNFLILNMFVGVIVESFQLSVDVDESRKAALARLRQEKKQKKQQERYDYCLKVYRLQFGPVQRKLVTFVEGQAFDNFVTVAIVCNVLSMCVEFHNQPSEMTEVLRYFNFVFTSIFALEAILKIKVFGVTCYFSDSWNKFDFFIVIMSFVGIFIDETFGSDSGGLDPAFIRVMRVFRIARMIKLVKSAKGLQALLETTLKSLQQVGSVCLLLFLIFFIYAAAGVAMFGRLSCLPANECSGISIHANFENFGMAMLTLFRVNTGDNGNGILKDAMRSDNCNKDPNCEYNCCDSLMNIVAPVYFLSFTVMAQFVLLNVVIAVLMNELEESQREQQEQAEAERRAEERAEKLEAAEIAAAEEVANRQAEMKSAGVIKLYDAAT